MSAPKNMTAIDSGVEDGIEWATVTAPLYGAVNGYARIPDGHPWHGLSYDEVDDHLDWDNELTYGRGDGWIGFDTLHAGDIWPGAPRYGDDWGTHWTAEMVADVARSLARQVAQSNATGGHDGLR